MRICIINTHTNNFGDDAACVALAMQLRKEFPDAHLDFLYQIYEPSNPIPFEDENSTHYNNLVIFKQHMPEAIRYILSKKLPLLRPLNGDVKKTASIIRRADVVISAPCGANIGIYRDWIHLFRVLVAVEEGYKPILHLNTVGKSGNILFDKISKHVLKRSKVYVREGKSKREMDKWGIECEQGVDTAFSLPDRNVDLNIEKEYMAFVPTKFDNWHKSYKNNPIDKKLENKMKEVAEFVKENDLDIRIIPHLTGVNSEYNLLEEYKELLVEAGVNEKNIHVEKDCDTFWKYEDLIANAKLTLSMRYHGVIFSIKNYVPFLSLAYENKMLEACKYSKMTKYNFDIKKIDNVDLKKQLNIVVKDSDKIKETLKAERENLRNLSQLPVQNLKLSQLTE
ncbi:polysaccharide pyruvyl transferase family protein [Macrococcus animalis]|uniref:polysaccharide pyruvyl transferase family protein n=1 Tax=Macrococcus animalis TaxID=3395467 RepID=UPI0039BE6E0D